MQSQKNPKITRMELATILNDTPDRIKHHLKKMTEQGVIKHIGATKAGKWIILTSKNLNSGSSFRGVSTPLPDTSCHICPICKTD